MISLVVFIILLVIKVDVAQSDECSSHQVFEDFFRSISEKIFACQMNDYYISSGWHRYKGDAGNIMLNYCPKDLAEKDHYCGAENKGWMSGSLPKQSDGIVSRTVYFARGTDCKGLEREIKVRNCGTFYVYDLGKAPAGCSGYCGYYSSPQPQASSSRSISSVQPSTPVSKSTVTELFSASPSTSSVQPTTPVSQNVVTKLFSTSPSTSSVQPTTPVSKNTVTKLFSASPSTSSVQPTTPVSQNIDGCNTYQVLSDITRAVTYADGSYQRCDANLNGWYRFKGDAGNRMLDYCPLSVSGSSHNRCGTAMQGWIASGSMPSQYEGEVSRIVCFSDSNSCRCLYQKQIKVRNCGTFYVYWLDGVLACNHRYCGVKVEDSKSSSTFLTTTLLWIGGVVILVVLVAMLLVKMRRDKSRSGNRGGQKQLQTGIDHAPSGEKFVITDEGDAYTKNAEEQEHAM